MKKNHYGLISGVCKIWKSKFLKRMKIVALLILISITQTFALNAYAQSKRLSVNFKNEKIINILDKIEDQSEFYFMFDASRINVNQRKTVDCENQLITNILDQLFEDTGITYSIKDRQVLLTTIDKSDTEQQKTISGKVSDSSGSPLPGVTVVVKGTTHGTVTNAEGDYSLTNIPEDAILQFSFVGMKTQEIAVPGKSTIDVVMQEETIGLEEVVAVGYGTQKRATITGSIGTIDGKKLQSVPTINYTNSLAGRLPGLVAVTRSGEPGNDATTLRIRGANTLGNNNPLIIVDGITERSIQRLEPSDIDNITVLKDASAAIYGAQAANGVILVTTKRGLVGKPEVKITFNQGWSMPTVIPEMADAATYAQLINEVDIYNNQVPRYSEEKIQKYKDGSNIWEYPNTDWFAEAFKHFAPQTHANFSVRGGSESMKYYVSIGTNYQDAIYKNSATHYSQADFRSNIDGKVSKNIHLSLDVSGRQENRHYPTRSAEDIFEMLIRGKPIMPAYWPNGKPGPDIEYGDNPVVITTNQTGYDKDRRYIFESRLSLNISIPWIKGLSVSGNASFDKNILNDKLWQTPWYLYSWDGLSYDTNNEPLLVKGQKGVSDPRLTQTMSDASKTTLNVLINYEHKITDNHYVKILLGSERIKGESTNFHAFRRYFVSTALDQMFAGGDLGKDNGGSEAQSARLNYFGRINYDFQKKYLFEFLWRYDGSYIFPKNKRYGFFPGISLGWRISEENLWKEHLAFINYFKIRGSWGQTGNDRIAEYQYLSSYKYNSNYYVFNENIISKTMQELRIPNLNVTWEVANQSNIGFDSHLFDDKFSISGDYFYNLRSNILWNRNASVPTTTGLSLPKENIGKVVNQGFEFEVTYTNKYKDFNYSVSANIGFQKNKIKFWDETPGVPEYQKSTGHPMNSALYYKAIGVFKDQADIDAYPHWDGARPGDIIFKDVNDDKVINALDKVRIYKTDLPTLTGGMNIDFEYKNFYSSIFLQGASGAVRSNYFNLQGESGNYFAEDAKGRWTENSPSATKPRIWNTAGEYWRAQSNTYWLKNSDYLRLKNIVIGYNLPDSIKNRLGVAGMQIYVSGTNLITLDKIKNFDPETTSSLSYPLNKVFNIGFTLDF